MNKLIKKFSPTTELIVILIIGFGLFIYSSTLSFFVVNSDYTHSWTYRITSQGHFSILIYETIAFLIIIYILKVRDWKLWHFNLSFTIRLIWIALLIMLIRNFISNIGLKILEIFKVVDDTTVNHVQYGLEANWISILLIIIINSIFEEFILIGYLFKRLEKYHPVIIIGFSILIRQLYHTYQGWLSLAMILPTGLVFGYYYYKFKKLWPVIIAHGFSNLIAFLGMHFHWYSKMHNPNGQ
jgi:membrane protease YdiL (CAAX protease family)